MSFQPANLPRPHLSWLHCQQTMSRIQVPTCQSWQRSMKPHSEWAICETWSDELRPKPTPYNPSLLRVPVLLITGERSWKIPRNWTDQLAQALPDATTAIVPGVGLSGSQSRSWSECTTKIYTSFISDPEATINTQCLAAEKEILWITLP